MSGAELRAVLLVSVVGASVWIAAGLVLALPVATALSLPMRSPAALDAAFFLGLIPGVGAAWRVSQWMREILP